jgi:hypothetical protein
MIKLKNLITESHYLDTAYQIGPSQINGKGVIAIKIIPNGSKSLAHIHDANFNTYAFSELGYFINHSETPNCIIQSNGNRRYIQTIEDIQPESELTCNYWVGPDDLEKPDTFETAIHDKNGLRISKYWDVKKINNISEPYVNYVMTRR